MSRMLGKDEVLSDEGTPQREVRMMLETHRNWLNGMAERNTDWDQAEVKLDDYWLLSVKAADGQHHGPMVVWDSLAWDEDPVKWYERRVMVVEADPFWDEGGSARLTGFFIRFETSENWELRAVVQEFDTVHDLILRDGELVIWDA